MTLNRAKVVQEAEKYVARGKVPAAIKEYRRLLAENPDDVTTLNRVGDLYVQNNQTDEAIRLFWDVAERYARDGFRTRAIAIFKKVIRTAPGRLDAYERLAELYAEERLVNDALQQYQVLVDYYVKHANPGSAAKILQKMAAVQPEDPSILLRLADLYEKQQLHEKALAEYRKIAELMLRHGKAEEAQQVFARAIELAPQDLGFVTDMVLGLKDAGHIGLAARLLTRAVELNPQAERISKLVGTLRPSAQREVPPPEPVVAPPPARIVEPAPPTAPAASAPPPTPTAKVAAGAAPAPSAPQPETPRPASPAGPLTFGDVDLEVELEAIPGMDGGFTPAPAPVPPRPSAHPPEEEIEILFEGLDDEPPSTLVQPPADMLPPAPGRGPALPEIDLGELPAIEAPSAAVPSRGTLDVEFGEEVTELPADIEWRFEAVDFDLEVPLPSETQPVPVAGPGAPEPPPQSVAPPTVDLDTAALERSVQEIQRKPPREAELLAEAEVFAKYELIEKAHDRIREVLHLNPRHLGALTLAVQLHLKEGRADRALARAQQLARAAAEAGKPEAWQPVRQKLLNAGFDLGGEEFAAPPAAAGKGRDGLSALVDSLVVSPAPRKAAPAPPSAKRPQRIEAELDALASSVLAKPGKGKPKAPPAAVPPPPPAAAQPPSAAPPAAATIQPIRVPVAPLAPPPPSPPAAAPVPPASVAREARPATPEPPTAAVRQPQSPGLGAIDEDELPGIRIPMKAPSVGATPPPASKAASPDELHWLDEVIANAPAARPADEKLFDDEDGFFDLAAELEQELSRDELFEGGDLVPMPKEPSLEEIVEGFKKGVAESLSPEDVDTHYNLGIAYREMGLLDDAIGEFQVAAKDARYFVECSSMLGICFLEKGIPELAIKWYKRALDAPDLAEETALGLRYDLGTAQMAAGDNAAARATFIEVYGINSNFRDVVALLTELEPEPDA